MRGVTIKNGGNETVHLSEEEVSKKGVKLHLCNGTKVVISGKISNLTVAECTDVTIEMDSAMISGVLTKGKNLNIHVHGSVPSFNLDHCYETFFHLSENAMKVQVFTCNSQTTVLNFPAQTEDAMGNMTRSIPVQETWKTIIHNDKLITEPVDMSE